MKVFQVICIYITILLYLCLAERFQYISTEHPTVTYLNTKYIEYFIIKSKRFGRNNPFYYVDIHARAYHVWGTNITVDFYFFEWLTNQYKRSFVEMHFNFCDLINKDKFFGASMKQGKLTGPCPYSPGVYDLYNMTIPLKQIPPHFPFTKGRIYSNVTAADHKELMVTGYIDMEIKEFNTNRIK